jgi:predicted CXXCH cytochrome family protein
LGVSLLWAGGSALLGVLSNGQLSQSVFSPGEVAAAHSRWGNDCRVCHEPGAPQSVDARWLASGARTGDVACLTCHADVAQTRVDHRDVAACSSCHSEHRGTDAALVRMHDIHCTRCHADMSPHPVVARDRTAHSSTLRFDHALHLRPGLGRTNDPPARPFRWRDITADAARLRLMPGDVTVDSPVELTCSACHQSDRNDTGFQSVRFESHCRACHALPFDPDQPDREVPHGLQPADVLTYLRGTLRTASEAGDDDPVLRQAAQLLFRGQRVCSKCHELPPTAPDSKWLASVSAVVISASTEKLWSDHVIFHHDSHRAIGCRECHAAAFPGHPAATASSSQSLLPRLAVCTTCHSQSGGSRHGCADCHRFHLTR